MKTEPLTKSIKSNLQTKMNQLSNTGGKGGGNIRVNDISEVQNSNVTIKKKNGNLGTTAYWRNITLRRQFIY